ncbi:ras-induced vulval development antagonist-domain-containing protein [Chytriomyces sp. MP71]|nr:ras-induced vulval development antagonist-domain-containing protein [Chytriomyces sp. MP71]
MDSVDPSRSKRIDQANGYRRDAFGRDQRQGHERPADTHSDSREDGARVEARSVYTNKRSESDDRRGGRAMDEFPSFSDTRRRQREDNKTDFWPKSPVRRDDGDELKGKIRSKGRKKRPDSDDDLDDSESEDSDSEDSDDSRRKVKRKSNKSKKSSSSKSIKKSKSKKSKKSSKKRKRRDSSDDDSSVSDSKSGMEKHDNDASRAAIANEEADKREAQEFWQEKQVVNDEDEPVGPAPLPEQDMKLDSRAYGGALLAGEGSALAAYVQSGKRIPRRGEIGLQPEEIQAYEDVGFVMSGSRHRRMNAVRIRKENQVISAEEKNALLMFAQQEKLRKETETIALLKEMVSAKMKPAE